MLVKVPKDNKVFHYVKRKFSWEGFYKLGVIEAFAEIGYSKSEARRLLNAGGIKIWDSEVHDGGIRWYKRTANPVELVEPEDVFIFGKPKALIVKQVPFSLWERIYYRLRTLKEQLVEV